MSVRTVGLLCILAMTALLAGCSEERVAAPDGGVIPADLLARAEPLAQEVVAHAGWPVEGEEDDPAAPTRLLGRPPQNEVQFIGRSVITGGVAHYEFRVRTGPGPCDFIGLHRVVRERAPGRPIRTRVSVFMQHGDAKNFVGMFLPGINQPSLPDDFGFAVFMAENDVDVWGIDQSWTLLDYGDDDDCMAGVGLDRNVADLRLAIAVARIARRMGGNGYGQMLLGGYSSGSCTGYALLNLETQVPRGLRQVKGFMPIDLSPLSDIPEWRQAAFGDYIPGYEEMIANGEYVFPTYFDVLGTLAREDPDGDSPIFPGFTNLQAALYMAAGPIFGWGGVHYHAGIWEDEMPVGLQHVTVDQWLDFATYAPPFEATQFALDFYIWCYGEEDVPWDDHFAQITVPVLNVAAAGGLGPTTLYNLTLLGSDDIQSLYVQLLPEDQALYDFGHIDIFTAGNAQGLVWEPMLAWIRGHSHPGRSGEAEDLTQR